MEIVDFNGSKLYKWNIGPSTFIANPVRGARLMNWYLNLADGSLRDIIYWPDNADMGEGFAHVRGGNPILFPFCGRNHIDGLAKHWKTLDGKVLPMENHGYARQGEFEVLDATDFGFTAKFLPSAECQEAYPYNYEFTVTYRFCDFSLICAMKLENLGDAEIPFCAGHHFYFKMPWHEGAARRDYRILCDAKKAFSIDENGKLIPREPKFPCDFSDPELWNRINCKLKTNVVKFGPKNGEEDITIKIGDSPKPDAWTSVVAWTESDDSPFYCVEPWMGAPNASEHGGGLAVVKPNSSRVFSVEVSVL
ncbi:MAG: aldose epimerase [Opitutales bacterium]|nr:aldose epimerase [Opitutales bacterium]